jgi:hypothetical protein
MTHDLLELETPELERMARRKDGVEFGAPLDRAYTSDEWLALLNGLPHRSLLLALAMVPNELKPSEALKRATLIAYLEEQK